MKLDFYSIIILKRESTYTCKNLAINIIWAHKFIKWLIFFYRGEIEKEIFVMWKIFSDIEFINLT